MGRFIIELISNFYSITDNQDIDAILFGIAAIIAFSVAFNLVGNIFDSLGFYDSGLMSNVHWTIRVVVFAALTWIFKKIFEFINWLFSFSWWIYAIAIGIIILAIILLSFFKHKLTNKKLNAKLDNTTDKSIVEHKENEIQDNITLVYKNLRDYCPRCGSLLVNRKGPYGYFWGCESYPKCRYSRKFK